MHAVVFHTAVTVWSAFSKTDVKLHFKFANYIFCENSRNLVHIFAIVWLYGHLGPWTLWH